MRFGQSFGARKAGLGAVQIMRSCEAPKYDQSFAGDLWLAEAIRGSERGLRQSLRIVQLVLVDSHIRRQRIDARLQNSRGVQTTPCLEVLACASHRRARDTQMDLG